MVDGFVFGSFYLWDRAGVMATEWEWVHRKTGHEIHVMHPEMHSCTCPAHDTLNIPWLQGAMEEEEEEEKKEKKKAGERKNEAEGCLALHITQSTCSLPELPSSNHVHTYLAIYV